MLREEADHPLLQLAQHYDLQPVIAQCAAYHHASGAGARSAARPGTHAAPLPSLTPRCVGRSAGWGSSSGGRGAGMW
jgi:hypothetical protein